MYRNLLMTFKKILVELTSLRVYAFTYSREINVQISKTVHLKNPCTRVVIRVFAYFSILI